MSAKRASVSSPIPAKRARSDETTAKINAIVKALRDETLQAQKVPRNAREMLAVAASCALVTEVEERHAMQSSVFEHIREVFAEISQTFDTQLAEAKQAVDNKTAVLADLSVKIEAASAEVEEAGNATNTELEKFASRQDADRVASQNVKEALSKQKTYTREKDTLDKEKGKFTTIEEGNLKALLDGSLTDEKEMKKAAAKLIKDMEKIGADAALLASVPSVLLMKPEDRKRFDNMVIDSLKGDLADRQKSVEEKIAANESSGAEINAEVAAVETAAAEASNSKEEAAESVETAKRVHSEKISAQASLESTAEEQRADIATFSASAEKIENKLASFKTVEGCLEFLALRSNVPPTPKPVEEMAADAPEATVTA